MNWNRKVTQQERYIAGRLKELQQKIRISQIVDFRQQ